MKPSCAAPPYRPPLRRVYEASLAELQRAEDAEAAAGGAQAGSEADIEAGLRAERLAVARRDLASLRTDTTQLAAAWQGLLAGGELAVAASAAGLAALGRLMQAARALEHEGVGIVGIGHEGGGGGRRAGQAARRLWAAGLPELVRACPQWKEILRRVA
jgi:hypothetical protein